MTRPLIGITTQTLHAIDGIPAGLPASWVMNQRYAHAVTSAGGVPVLVPLLDQDSTTLRAIYDRLDAVFLPGGVDVDPATFGAAPHPRLGRIDPARDRVELTLARWAMDDAKPLFGLCRGLQVINVALGGTLHQDLASELPSAIKHDYFPTEHYTRDLLAHAVQVDPGSRLGDLLDASSVHVNSMHHQGVKALGQGLRATALAPDGLIEAVEGTDRRFIVGVQWHPEALVEKDPRMERLFTALVAAA